MFCVIPSAARDVSVVVLNWVLGTTKPFLLRHMIAGKWELHDEELRHHVLKQR